MEDECRLFDRSFLVPGSESKGSAWKKRAREEVEETPELILKNVKMRDLKSVFRSEERRANDTVSSDNLQAASMAIDLNTHCTSSNVAATGINVGLEQVNPLPSSWRQGMESEITSLKSGTFGHNLNAGDISSSNNNSFHGHDKYEHLKLKAESESTVSSVGPVDRKDPMKVWKEMKENGFLSSSHGDVPMPRQRGRRSKNDGIKKQIELAKKEQVDRFAKMAAPSGLLSELNPGIINHVRNSKQVHSIIEALVKSEKLEDRHAIGKDGDHLKNVLKDCSETTGLKTMSGFGLNRCTVSHEAVTVSTFAKSRGGDESSMVDTRAPGRISYFSHPNLDREDDIPALKLSSSAAMASENTSSLSNEESGNLSGVTSLFVNAATVASQWLELFHQDIKGRLAALRRSKKRVRDVIQTEIPFLLSKEFPSNDENQTCVKKSHTSNHSYHLAADAHRTRWTALFVQMEKTLAQEENQLESWLNQVREMQMHCDQGLLKYHNLHGLQQLGPAENQFRLNKSDCSEGDSAVQAAAASIYSTCNFLSSMENLPCC